MYSSVVTQSPRAMFLPFIARARSLVMIPSWSMVSTHAASRSAANLASSGVSSNLARKASPRVQAKMEATGLVEVSWPFWYWR